MASLRGGHIDHKSADQTDALHPPLQQDSHFNSPYLLRPLKANEIAVVLFVAQHYSTPIPRLSLETEVRQAAGIQIAQVIRKSRAPRVRIPRR